MLKKLLNTIMLFFLMFNFQSAFANQNLYRLEHLPQYKKTNTTIVKITADKVIIPANNAIEITFNSYFNSKQAQQGDIIDFSLPNGLSTMEGTCLLPCGTKIIGCITCIEKPRVFNRNAKVYVIFREILLPNGCTLPLTAYPFDKDNALKTSSLAAAGKAAAYTAGFFGVGSGLGAWIGSGSHAASHGVFYFGMPIGAAAGLLTGIITPGLHYRAKCGKKIHIRLEECLIIPTAP